ncbi:hypothetical protein [Streptomyces sp. NBC_01689]|uniref:hypothetical protein n=1 Tax=Streptomyces sp. NBC_01689 TaxID=2975911 RepID=UPI002E36D056|nr:hypothetical protein [Streptomyces sp. NBC_01689]
MTVDEYARWKTLAVRRPDDVPGATPLSWQIEKHGLHDDRLFNNALPADFPHEVERGDADDALAALALRESIRRDIEHGRGNRIHEALKLGATWRQIAAAVDVDTDAARRLLRAYADGQHNLHLRDVEHGEARPLGFNAGEYAATIALCELLGDDEVAPAPVGTR